MVAIPQSGLLSQVSSLRLPSGHSGPVLTLRMQPVPPCPAPACGGCRHLCCFYTEGATVGLIICGFYLFIFPPGYVTLCGSKARHRLSSESVSWYLETSIFFKTPFPGLTSIPTSFVSLFIFYIFFLPPFEDNGLLFWVPDVLCQHSEVVLWNSFSVQMFF